MNLIDRDGARRIITAYLVDGKMDEDFKDALLFALADMETLQEVMITVRDVRND